MSSALTSDRPARAQHGAAMTLTDAPSASDFLSIFRGLAAATEAFARTDLRALAVLLGDATGATIGGLWGRTAYRWLSIEMLFVPAPLRGQGLGSAMIAVAEAEARKRGCRGMLVDAISSQAGPFYQKLGFTPFGALPNYPPGHIRIFFRKDY